MSALARLDQEVAKTAVPWEQTPNGVAARFAAEDREEHSLQQQIARATISGQPAPSHASTRIAEIAATRPMRPAITAEVEKRHPHRVQRHEAAKDKLRREVHRVIVEGPLADVRAEVSSALDQLFVALTRMIGVDEVAFREFNPRPYGRDAYEHPQGPGGELLDLLKKHNWPGGSDSIRPNWLRPNYPIDMSAAVEAAAATRTFVEKESAA